MVQRDEEILVAIIEDDRPTRDALEQLVNGASGLRCRGTYPSAEIALRGLGPVLPDVLLLDINLPGMSGTDAVRPLRELHPKLAILMLTVFADEAKIFAALCNGASGYLLKTTTSERLISAIREAHFGGAPMSTEIARRVLGLFRRFAPANPVDYQLTPQELRMLSLLAEGHAYQQAADDMGVSINTLRNHIRSVYEKLHVHSASGAVSKAIRAGLI